MRTARQIILAITAALMTLAGTATAAFAHVVEGPYPGNLGETGGQQAVTGGAQPAVDAATSGAVVSLAWLVVALALTAVVAASLGYAARYAQARRPAYH